VLRALIVPRVTTITRRLRPRPAHRARVASVPRALPRNRPADNHPPRVRARPSHPTDDATIATRVNSTEPSRALLRANRVAASLARARRRPDESPRRASRESNRASRALARASRRLARARVSTRVNQRARVPRALAEPRVAARVASSRLSPPRARFFASKKRRASTTLNRRRFFVLFRFFSCSTRFNPMCASARAREISKISRSRARAFF
jgi:hypothetical protein